ncbi:MAG: ATP-binding cassette domain-containing protein [Ignavibacteria bacterium]|nr:ATP-binding cassette domain-containing protein [Ignavibacteria bacterium]
MTAVEFINISKKFGSFYANEDISFAVKKNSVHCILGENGAGKTTLMKILFGIYRQDSGVIKIFDDEVRFISPHDAIDKKSEWSISILCLLRILPYWKISFSVMKRQKILSLM